MKILLDNSVVQRLPRSSEVSTAVRLLLDAGHTLCSSPISVLEAGYSARTSIDHRDIVANLTRSFELLRFDHSTGDLAVALQAALFEAGTGRSVGVMDLFSAACAIEHGAHLVHYDSDFDKLAKAWSPFHQSWIVPRGSVS